MNAASPGSSFANVLDIISLDYQGEGGGTSTSGSFPSFHKSYPNKMIWTSESASALSTRGTYIFPVTGANSATVGDNSGGNSTAQYVSAYELYAAPWGSSPDKVFVAQDKYLYVAGEFVWSGFDDLDEPTPYDSSRSSYFGIIDLAGFKKTASICISLAGALIYLQLIFFPTGLGLIESVLSLQFMSSRLLMKRSYS